MCRSEVTHTSKYIVCVYLRLSRASYTTHYTYMLPYLPLETCIVLPTSYILIGFCEFALAELFFHFCAITVCLFGKIITGVAPTSDICNYYLVSWGSKIIFFLLCSKLYRLIRSLYTPCQSLLQGNDDCLWRKSPFHSRFNVWRLTIINTRWDLYI